MPTLTQLEYVVAVEKYRHFSKAARACNISQPTLSVQIQKMEDELGIIIFDRIQKPIIPTEEGKRFLEQAKAVLREHQKLIQVSKKTAGEVSGDFRLGIIPTVASSLVPLLIHEFSERFPKVDLFIEESKTETLLSDLRGDRLDGGILATPLEEGGLKEHPLYYEPFLLYISKGHPLLKKDALVADDLDGSELWLLQDGHCFKNQVVKFCSIHTEAGSVSKNVHFQSGSLETLKNLVRKGSGYTMLPGLMALSLSESELKNHIRKFKAPVPTREISFVYRRDHWKLDIIRAIEQIVEGVVPAEYRQGNRKEQTILGIC